MSSGQKVALSFLAALICFAGFVFFAETNLMSTIETKFYAQSKIAQRQEQLDKLSESCNNYISNILTKIETDSSSYLNSSAVKTYANQNPSEKDEVTRRNLTSALFDTIEGLDGMRLIEGNGRNVHFSTYDTDVLKVDGLVKQYKNYTDLKEELGELESEVILTDANNPKHKIILDDKQNRLIISFPFYITEQTTFGSLVCYFNIYDFVQILVNNDLLPLGESFDLLMDEDGNGYGFACGIPGDGKSDFTKAIINSWKIASGKTDSKNKGPENLISQSNGTNWVLLNSSEKTYFNVGWVFKASVFELPKELIYIIYISVFITLLLIFLLIFSLKKDYLIKVKQRIKKVQLGIIREYLENKQQIEWDQIARQLEYRKEELSLEIKKSVGGKNKKYEKIIDVYLEQSWSEIINIINSQNNNQKSGLSGASIEEIRRVMEEVLQTAKLNVSVAPGAKNVVQTIEDVSDAVEEIDEIEEVDEIEEAEEVDDLEDAEALEEVEEAESVEEIEEVEAVDELEDVEPIEEVEEVSDLDDAEVLEEIEDTEPADETESVEPTEDVEEIEEAAELDEVEDAEELDNADEAESLEDVDEFEDIEIEKVEDAEEIEEIDVSEEFGELTEVGELEELDSEDISLENSAMTKAEPEYHYVESNRTFVSSSSDDFANCDTIFAEDLCIGTHYTPKPSTVSEDFNFVVYIPDFTPEHDFDMELEAADELIPEEGRFFSMTGFAENDLPVSDLEEVEDAPAIVEKKGVYSIAENLECSHLELNPEFKELVDSVLFR